MKGLPWIRLDTDLREHPKADRLADELGDRRAWTHVVELWMWAGANQPDGDLSQMPDTGIARRSGYDGSAAGFVAALIKAGFLDEQRQINGWEKRQGTLVEKFKRDRLKPDGRKPSPVDPPKPVPDASLANPVRDTGGSGQNPAPLPHGDVDGNVDGNVGTQDQVPAAAVAPAVASKQMLTTGPTGKGTADDLFPKAAPTVKPKATKAKPKADPEKPNVKADREEWVALYVRTTGAKPGEVIQDVKFCIRYAVAHGERDGPTLLRALAGALTDPYWRGKGIGQLISEAAIGGGLAILRTTTAADKPNSAASRQVNAHWAERQAEILANPPVIDESDFQPPEAA